jgi:hypothetical protein
VLTAVVTGMVSPDVSEEYVGSGFSDVRLNQARNYYEPGSRNVCSRKCYVLLINEKTYVYY